jgi:hypothetical protein
MTALRISVALMIILGGFALTPRSELPVTNQQRILTTESAARLRDGFNRKDCLSIYHESAQFFRTQREIDWSNDCADLRTDLGAWRTLTIQNTFHCGGAIVCIDGFATFEKATKRVELGWGLDKDHAKLMWFVIEDNRQT